MARPRPMTTLLYEVKLNVLGFYVNYCFINENASRTVQRPSRMNAILQLASNGIPRMVLINYIAFLLKIFLNFFLADEPHKMIEYEIYSLNSPR